MRHVVLDKNIYLALLAGARLNRVAIHAEIKERQHAGGKASKGKRTQHEKSPRPLQNKKNGKDGKKHTGGAKADGKCGTGQACESAREYYKKHGAGEKMPVSKKSHDKGSV